MEEQTTAVMEEQTINAYEGTKKRNSYYRGQENLGFTVPALWDGKVAI
jgi:hypothetical protein